MAMSQGVVGYRVSDHRKLHANGSLSFKMAQVYVVQSITPAAFLRASARYHEETILEELYTLLIFATKDLRFSSLD